MKALRNLKIVGLSLLSLMAIGITGFHFIEGWPWFDGLYMVVTTFTTIGYQEVHPLSPTGRVFNIALIVVGVALLFLSIGFLTQALLEFELGKFFGRRRMERDISRLSDHYILCGAGRVGRAAARELARKPVPFVVIESDPAKAAKYSADAWLTMIGDATEEKVLREARIEHARGLVAATTTDATNLYIVLTARSLNPNLRIIARASEEEAEKHLLSAGADSVVSPYSFAGHRIAYSFLRPNVLDFLDVATARHGRLDLEIEEIHVEPGSVFAGATIGSSKIRQETGVIVLAIKREGGMTFNPAPEDSIEAGDYLIAMGEPASLRRLEQTAAARTR
ncbi:MAG TPA: potassium channel protein [Terriglobales bacterium]|nr:potassium channel protein [Terriglobales bacterium]